VRPRLRKPHAAAARLALALGASASLLACAGAPPPPSPAPSPVASVASVPAVVASAAAAAEPPDAAAPLVHVQLLAINDFHGNLKPPAGSNGVILAAGDDPVAAIEGARPVGDAGAVLVPTGGAAYLATHIARLRAENPSSILVSAGDLTGASPLLSNLFKDEPSILVMNCMRLDLEAAGNHDFDRGRAELQRLQHGGCAPGEEDAGSTFPGASFTYLAANVVDEATQKTVFPPYVVREVGGAKIAFVGETLKETPSVTVAAAVKGLRFDDEAKTANALVPELKAQGVSAIVLVLHQGGMQGPGGTYDSCVGFSGDITRILSALDPAFDVVVSAHTHQAYDCTIDGRLVTSAASYGRLVTKIDLTIDPASRRVVEKHARNVPVTRDVTPDVDVTKIVVESEARASPVTGRVVGYVKADFTGDAKAAGAASCETPLGDLIADAEAAATRSDIAFMNPGGIRADLVAKRAGRPDNAITYAEAFEVHPFGNKLATLTLTGAQIRALLEAQFGSRAEPRILQVSKGFSYRYSYDRATRKGAVDQITVRGAPLDPAKTYRVTVPSFIAGGGDGFSVLKEASARKEGGLDLDALTAYLRSHSSARAPLAPSPAATRIQGDGCK
jgi:5'-nucleotidase